MDTNLRFMACFIPAFYCIWTHWASFTSALPANAHFWDKCFSKVSSFEGNGSKGIEGKAPLNEPRAVQHPKILSMSCTGFRDNNNGSGLHYLGFHINPEHYNAKHAVATTKKGKGLTYGVKVTHAGDIGAEGVLDLAATEEFQTQLKNALRDQLGWMYVDNITYFGKSSELVTKYDIGQTSGALAFQYGASCTAKLVKAEGKESEVRFRFETEKLIFYMPSYGKCEPTDGFLPIMKPGTDSNEYENKGTKRLAVNLNMSFYLTWENAPPLKFRDVYQVMPMGMHVPNNTQNPIQKKFNDEFWNKTSARTGLIPPKPFPYTYLPATEEEDESIAPGTVGHLYEHVLVCGGYRLFTAAVHQRAYSLADGSCVDISGPPRRGRPSVLEKCDVCPTDLKNNCDANLILPITRPAI